MNPKVLIISCIRNRAWILPKFLEAIDNIDYPNYECFFMENDSTDNTFNLLKEYQGNLSVKKYLQRVKSDEKNIPDETRTQYRKNGYSHLADIRNILIEETLLWHSNFDYVLSIDSDIIVPKSIITDLLTYAGSKTIVAGAIANIPNKTVDGIAPCNFMTIQDGRMAHMREYPTSGLIEVDLTGAVYMIPMKCLKDGVRYGADPQGEDKVFCEMAKAKGYKLLVNLDCKPKHYMVKENFND